MLIVSTAQCTAADAPSVGRFYPAGLQRGSQVQVQAVGKFGNWPIKAWTDRPGLSIEPLAEPGKLLVRAADDAMPGVYWVRLYNAAGASELRPLVVGTLIELNEREPNDSWRRGQPLQRTACTMNGRLGWTGDCDVFAVDAKAGQTLVAWVEANRPLGSPMDGVLQILDSGGNVIAENHDFVGLDPWVTLAVPSSGQYFVRLFAFPAKPTAAIELAGGDEFVYRLTVTTGPAINYAFPLALTRGRRQTVQLRGWNLSPADALLTLEPDGADVSLTAFRPPMAGRALVAVEDLPTLVEQEPNGRDRAQQLPLPSCVSGSIQTPGDEDAFTLVAVEGQTLSFRLESAELGFPLDGMLTLDDADGNRLATSDDAEGRRDPELTYTAPLAGEYRLTVRDLHGHGGWRYAYRLRATLAEPDFALKVASTRWSGKAGERLEIPVSIERINGFEAPIRVSAGGLPESITCLGVDSIAGEASANQAVLKLSLGKLPFSGPIRIVGKAAGARTLVRSASADTEGLPMSSENLWLTIVTE